VDERLQFVRSTQERRIAASAQRGSALVDLADEGYERLQRQSNGWQGGETLLLRLEGFDLGADENVGLGA
jgi:hypothetical protein